MADSAFPVGGFAYSNGLESAIKNGFILDQKGMHSYLHTYAEQLISFDFAFVAAAHQLDWVNPDIKKVSTLIHSYEAMLLNPPLQKANCVLGRNWMRICRQFGQSRLLEELDNLLAREQFAYEFPIVFGSCLNLLKCQLDQTLYLFFYMALRDQISAMIRLGIAGPSKAHIELRAILDSFKGVITQYQPVAYQKAYKSAYLLEIAQLKHEQVYSKLFQN